MSAVTNPTHVLMRHPDCGEALIPFRAVEAHKSLGWAVAQPKVDVTTPADSESKSAHRTKSA